MLIRYGTDKNGKLVKKAVVYTKSEHLISNENIDPDALQTISRLRDAGFSAYLVGGAVRDLIVGNKPKDFDIVTDATPSRIKRIFRNSRIIGRRFRLVHVVYGTKIFEVSTFRSNAEGSVGNDFGTIEEDVLRRDFTMNALYYDPSSCQVLDYVGGMKDIKKHVLRPVIDLERIFVEDPVRMLRAIKYSATTHAKMSRGLHRKILSSAKLLSQVSPSRLTEEILKIINSPFASSIIREALDTDLYIYLQPAATGLIYDNKAFEKKYMQSLKELDELNKSAPETRLGSKMIFLLRDFIESLTDWQKEIENKTSYSELYAKTWTECRNYVLPMNPIRKELEFAVKQCLIQLGVKSTVKKAPKTAGKTTEKSAEKSAGKTSKTSVKTAAKPVSKSSEKSAGKSKDKSSAKKTEKSSAKSDLITSL